MDTPLPTWFGDWYFIPIFFLSFCYQFLLLRKQRQETMLFKVASPRVLDLVYLNSLLDNKNGSINKHKINLNESRYLGLNKKINSYATKSRKRDRLLRYCCQFISLLFIYNQGLSLFLELFFLLKFCCCFFKLVRRCCLKLCETILFQMIPQKHFLYEFT